MGLPKYYSVRYFSQVLDNCVRKNGYKPLYDYSNVPRYENLKNNALIAAPDDVSEIKPYYWPTFNLAAYVNNSVSLQNLIELGVDLSKIEKKHQNVHKLLRLHLEKDIKSHVMFLKDYVDKDYLGKLITKNPLILCEPLNDLEVRINYLKSKNFSSNQIEQIISRNPFWLMFSTKRIDKRLGFYQKTYNLQGNEVRTLAAKQPKVITYNLHHIKTNTFVLKEEMGFEENEIKQVVLEQPKLLMSNQKVLLERFNYIHNVIKIPHKTILLHSGILLCRQFKFKQRHLFLSKLGRAQYDPKKENYVPIIALAEGSDLDFCKQYAKCTINDLNIFLKTL